MCQQQVLYNQCLKWKKDRKKKKCQYSPSFIHMLCIGWDQQINQSSSRHLPMLESSWMIHVKRKYIFRSTSCLLGSEFPSSTMTTPLSLPLYTYITPFIDFSSFYRGRWFTSTQLQSSDLLTQSPALLHLCSMGCIPSLQLPIFGVQEVHTHSLQYHSSCRDPKQWSMSFYSPHAENSQTNINICPTSVNSQFSSYSWV